jgi:hypothetical protein
VSCLISSLRRDMHENSTWVEIDTFSTYCLTNEMKDFSSPSNRVRANVTGVAGKDSSTITYQGEGVFRVVDDYGETCKIPIPYLYYCETVPYKVISPRHLDKCWKETGTGKFKSTTSSESMVIEWTDARGNEHTKTISHTTKSGIPVCYTAPSYARYKKYVRKRTDLSGDDRNLVACLSKSDIPLPEGVKKVDVRGNELETLEEHLVITYLRTKEWR